MTGRPWRLTRATPCPRRGRPAARGLRSPLGRGARAHPRAGGRRGRGDLNRVHDPLNSPLVWDLGHIAAFEELWLCRNQAGLEPLAPGAAAGLRRLRDAARQIAARCPTCACRRRCGSSTECASARWRCSTASDPYLVEMVVQHEHQHGETMLQTLQLAEPGTYAPDRERDWEGVIDHAAPRGHPGRLVLPRRPGPGLRLRQRAARPRARAARLRDRLAAGVQRRLRRVRRGRRLPLEGGLGPRGLGVGPASRPRAPALLDRATARSGASTASSRSTPTCR